MNTTNLFTEWEDFDEQSREILTAYQNDFLDLDYFEKQGFGNFANVVTNNVILGETIRGIHNVSPLAAVKFYNQTSDDIYNKYFPDANESSKGNTTILEDPNIVTKGGYDFNSHDFHSDKNKNGIKDEDEQHLFKLLIFVSTDGNKVKECYEVVKPAADEIILFLETDEDGLSNQKLYGRISEKVRKTYVDTTTGKLYNAFFEGDIVETVKKYLSQANKEIIEELLLKGYIADKSISASFFKGLKYVLLATSAPSKALGWVLNTIGNGIDFLKIPDNFWDTENEGYYFQKDKLIENLSISSDKLNLLKNLFTDKKGLDLTDFTLQMVDDVILKLISVIESFIGHYNNYVKTKIEEIFKTLENPQMQEQTEKLAEKVALICGIWNGVVDFVSSIFKFLGMLLEAPFNISKDFQYVLEMIDNFWEICSSGKLWENLESAISTGITKMVEYLKSKNGDDVNWVRINYVAGFAIAFVGTLFIPLANIAKLANVGKGGDIFLALNKKVNEAVIKTSNFAKKVETSAIYNSASKALQELFEMIAKGRQKLQDFVDKALKEIAEWFLKNKKAGMAENINTAFRMTVKEFEAGLVKLSKIKPNEAVKYLDEALIYFNHHVVGGKVVQISDRNCVNVVQKVEEFLETGKISTALVSDAQNYTVLQNKFGKTFLPIDSLKTLENIQYMKEGERGILLCIRGGWDSNHVINIIVKEGKLLFKDAQVYSQLGSNKVFLSNNYKEFKFFKTKIIK